MIEDSNNEIEKLDREMKKKLKNFIGSGKIY